MATTLYNRIIANARQDLPGVVDNALKLALFNVLDEFFVNASIWREFAEFTTEEDTLTYSIDPDSSNAARIVRLIEVKTVENEFVLPATMSEPGEVVLDTQPTANLDCTAEVVLSVGDPLDADGYPYAPAWIIEKYYAGLTEGLLGKLMVQPAKPYSNERMSILHMRKFNGAIAQARVDANHANLHRAQNWAFPRGWA